MTKNRRTLPPAQTLATKAGFWPTQLVLWSGLAVVDFVLRVAIYKDVTAAATLSLLMLPAALLAAGGMRYLYRQQQLVRRPPLPTAGIVLATSVVVAVLWVALAAGLRMHFGWTIPHWDAAEAWLLFGTFHTAVILGWSLAYVWLATAAERTAAEHNVEAARHQALKHELDKLRLQLEPHFLFNVLNGVGTEIVDHPDRALTMVRELADFVRGALMSLERPIVTVEEELGVLWAYLGLQQARFGSHLTVSRHIDAAALSRPIASFLLQPLLENACRHADSGQPMRIDVQLHANDTGLTLDIVNPGELSAPRQSDTGGLGLRNLKRRLALHYPGRHTFSLEALPATSLESTPRVRARLHLEGEPCSA